MLTKTLTSSFAFCLLFTCASEDSPQKHSKPLRIYAAASLVSVLPKVAKVFEEKYPEAEIEFNFAASSILAKQIARGANANLFFSANLEWVDFLENKNRISPGSRLGTLAMHPTSLEFLSNSLVLIAPEKSKIAVRGLQDLNRPFVKRVALADWAHVPAGMYAREALENFGIWEDVVAKCLPALDVRAAVSYVARGDADCGIVYRTDALMSKKVKIVDELPAQIQPRIRYSVARISSSSHPLDKDFLSFLLSSKATDIFRESGFTMLEQQKKQ